MEEVAHARIDQPLSGHPACNLTGDELRVIETIIFDVGDMRKADSLPGEVPLGEFVPVKIDGAITYDLMGQVELKQRQVITLQ